MSIASTKSLNLYEQETRHKNKKIVKLLNYS